ncbi:hypothetical protein ACVWW1_008448 [Bradyrhizobium sp. JR3.5]
MPLSASNRDADPFQTAFADLDIALSEFSDDRRLGKITALDSVYRAKAASFLIDHGMDGKTTLKFDTCRLDASNGSNGGRNAALHVDGATPVKLATLDFATEGIDCPGAALPHRDHIDMAAQQQAAVFGAGQLTDDVRSVREDVPPVDRHAKRRQLQFNQILDGALAVLAWIIDELRVDRGNSH